MVKYCRWRTIGDQRVLIIMKSLDDLIKKLYYVFDPETDVHYTEEEYETLRLAYEALLSYHGDIDAFIQSLDEPGGVGRAFLAILKWANPVSFDLLHKPGGVSNNQKNTEGCIWV